MVVIGDDTCPHTHRIRIALAAKSLAHEVDYVELANKPQRLLEVSPRGIVPVLLHEGRALFESLAVVEYIEDCFPEPPLRSSDPYGRAVERALSQIANHEVFPLYVAMVAARSRSEHERVFGELVESFRRIDTSLRDRDWLSGDGTRFGLPDLAMAPVIARLYRLRQAGLFLFPARMPDLIHWVQRLIALPVVIDTLPDDYVARERRASAQRGGSFLFG